MMFSKCSISPKLFYVLVSTLTDTIFVIVFILVSWYAKFLNNDIRIYLAIFFLIKGPVVGLIVSSIRHTPNEAMIAIGYYHGRMIGLFIGVALGLAIADGVGMIIGAIVFYILGRYTGYEITKVFGGMIELFYDVAEQKSGLNRSD